MRLSIFISFYLGRAFFSIQSSSIAFNLTHLPPVDNNRKFNSGVSGRLIFQGLCAGSMMDSYHLNCHHFKHLPASRQAERQVAWFGNLNGKGISVRGHSGKRDGIKKHGHLAVVSNWTSARNEHFEIAKETRTCSGIRKTDGNCICSLLGFVASRWRLKSVSRLLRPMTEIAKITWRKNTRTPTVVTALVEDMRSVSGQRTSPQPTTLV